VQLQCLLFLFLLHASYTGLIRSISPASVSTDPSRQSSTLLANIYARLPFVRRLKLLSCFCTKCRRSFLISSNRSPSIFVSHNKVQTKPHHDAWYSLAVRRSLKSKHMHAYVPRKPSYVKCYVDANQCHLSTPIDLFLLTSSCSQSCMRASFCKHTEANKIPCFIPCFMSSFHHADVIYTLKNIYNVIP
jgi:hypothetical protein